MNWAELVPNVSKQDNSLQDAFSALTISRVGQGNKDARLVHESTKMYVKALKELQQAILDPKRMYSDHVLMACMLLGLYEVFEGPAFNSRSWVAHAQGAARLIQLRGPERHQSWDAHHPFLASRSPTIYAAILQRKATYLATDEWLTIPWKTQHRTYFDRMVDLATAIPGMLEKFDVLRESDSDTTQDLAQLLDECKELQILMNRWKDGTKKGATPRVIKHDVLDADGYPFDTDLWFENHLFVHARLIYYACCLALNEAAEGIMVALELRGQEVAKSAEPSSMGEFFKAERHAANICRTVTYCLQPEMGAWGANIINFPANLAFAYYQRIGHTAATDWLRKAFQGVKLRGVHVDDIFAAFIGMSHGKDDPSYRTKRESSTDTSGSCSSPGSGQSLASTATTFVYEDPSKAYYDASNDPG